MSVKKLKTPTYNSPGKLAIRDQIFAYIQKNIENPLLLDFYGAGQSFEAANKLGINTISIDNGLKHVDRSALHEILNGPNLIYTELRDLCQHPIALEGKKFNAMWLDYCGKYCQGVRDDIHSLQTIMQNKGVIYFTLYKGREPFEKGTDRRLINGGIVLDMQEMFAQVGIKTTLIFQRDYMGGAEYDGRKKNGGTPMIVHGFTWEKI
jgi:hypothetical protein